MAVAPLYLVDKSALARMPLESVRRRLAPIIEAGEAATCSIVDLEVLFLAIEFLELPVSSPPALSEPR